MRRARKEVEGLDMLDLVIIREFGEIASLSGRIAGEINDFWRERLVDAVYELGVAAGAWWI